MCSRRMIVAGLVGSLALVALLMLTACEGCPFALPPTAAPSWPPGTPPQPALTYPAQSATTKDSISSEGWFFEPVVDIEVTDLGYYDDGRDGLLHAHRAAIFDSASRLVVVETTIGPHSPLDGLFRWEPVKPVVLKAGHEYAMVSSRDGPFDPEVPNPDGASLAPELLYLRYSETREDGSGWDSPARTVSNVFFSGNFKFKPASALQRHPGGTLD